MLLKNKSLMLLEERVLQFRSNTPNGGMLNPKRTVNNPKQLVFWSNFFNLLTRWLGGKLKSLPSLH